MSVGRIVQVHPLDTAYRRGEEKAVFKFGGSAIVVFGQPGAWRPCDAILQHTKESVETLGQLGDCIALGGMSPHTQVRSANRVRNENDAPMSSPASGIRLNTVNFKQRRAMCGPACLRIVCAYFGVSASEKRIALLCRSRTLSGTTGTNLVKAARSLGFSARIVDHARFKTIRLWLGRGVPIIVDWMSTEDSRRNKHHIALGHYSVVCGLSEKHIVLEDSRHREATKDVASDVLEGVVRLSGMLYPAHKNDLIMRRLIVVAPKELVSKRPRSSRRPKA